MTTRYEICKKLGTRLVVRRIVHHRSSCTFMATNKTVKRLPTKYLERNVRWLVVVQSQERTPFFLIPSSIILSSWWPQSHPSVMITMLVTSDILQWPQAEPDPWRVIFGRKVFGDCCSGLAAHTQGPFTRFITRRYRCVRGWCGSGRRTGLPWCYGRGRPSGSAGLPGRAACCSAGRAATSGENETPRRSVDWSQNWPFLWVNEKERNQIRCVKEKHTGSRSRQGIHTSIHR